MQKAYIITAHKYPEQLYRLVSRLNDGASYFFLHIDKTAELSNFRIIESFGKIIHFVDREKSHWASFGFVQATLNALKAIKASEHKFDRIILLSGQDYPIKSNEYINEFFINSPHSIFFEHYPIPNYQKWPGTDRGGWYRVDKYYFGLKRHQLFFSKFLNLLSIFLPFLKRNIPGKMKPYAGSTWWTIDMYALNYILNFSEQYPQFNAFHRSTFVPDEVYFHMIIANTQDKELRQRIENNNKRFYIWETSYCAHPNILRKTDFESIAASEHLFARKFDESIDSEILDLIDINILQQKKQAVKMH